MTGLIERWRGDLRRLHAEGGSGTAALAGLVPRADLPRLTAGLVRAGGR